MKRSLLLALLVAATGLACKSEPAAPAVPPEVAAWQARAQGVTIIRDDWGIPHISAKTDADAVFGLMYAQAEDDFNRVETNFINAMGRLAEAEGEKEIYRDLRMKLFIDPVDLKAQYDKAPAWLQAPDDRLGRRLELLPGHASEREAARASPGSSRGWRSASARAASAATSRACRFRASRRSTARTRRR